MLRLVQCSSKMIGSNLQPLSYLTTKKMSKKAVIFDMGGVLTPSPVKLFKNFALKNNLTAHQMDKIFFNGGDHSLFGQLERGEITLEEFPELLAIKSKSLIGTSLHFDIFAEFGLPEYCKPYPEMIYAIKSIREKGVKTALLTNNFRSSVEGSIVFVDKQLFDVVVESSVVGDRKPNLSIYKLTLNKLKLSANEAVFLDDIGTNLKSAESLGIHTIKVTNTHSALKELGEVLDLEFAIVPGTIEVKGQHLIPVENLKNFLKSELKLKGDSQDLILRKFKHGQSNPTYYVKFGGKEMVLRKKPPGKLLPSAHAIEREYRVMKALGNKGVPVPNVICLCEDSNVIGTQFYLMDYLRGRVFDGAFPQSMTSHQRSDIYKSLNQVLQKIHSIDVTDAGLEDYGKTGNYVGRQTSIWTKQYRASETQTIADMERLIDWLPRNLPETTKTTVVHGDFRLDNCIFDENSSEILAVLDWELSTLGDPLSDLAYTCMQHYLPSDFPIFPGLAGLELESLGIPSVNQTVEKYCRDMKIEGIEKWNVYMAFSYFRIAAILQGVYKRALDGQASSEKAKHAGKLVHFLASIACKFIDKEELKNIDENVFQTAENSSLTFTVKGLSSHAQRLHSKVLTFMKNEVYPLEKEIMAEQKEELRWTVNPLIDKLKVKARSSGLWNLFVPLETDPGGIFGKGLTNLEYAFICEEMGKVMLAPEIFNCSAPDTGNMEVLIKYGNKQQQEQWLTPLLEGRVRSCFGMTEPQVASSDATNIQSSIVCDGDDYVINGRKWWISGANDPRCLFCIFMGKTDPSAPKHKQQSMMIVPMNSPGVEVIRPLSVFGYQDAPSGHGEIQFTNVRVPAANLLLGEGRGFEIAQGRLGPGRIHHCMRLIGWSERALALMIERTNLRVAFGKPLITQGTIQSDIAESRIEIEQARLLTLKAAHMMDTVGNKAAAAEIAMIKVLAPRTAQNVLDRSIQAFGAAGLSAETPLAHMFAFARVLRLADGPDEVHKRSIARLEIKNQLGKL